MFSNNILCIIGSNFPINDICDFLVLKRGLDCNLFWFLIAKRLFTVVPKLKNYKNLVKSYMILNKNIIAINEYQWLTNYYESSRNWERFSTELISHDIKCFYGITNMISAGLRLSFNIKIIGELNFPYLQTLSLGNNILTSVSGLNLPNLRQLSIKKNSLSVFENNYFPKLGYLNLKCNLLEKIDLSSFTHLKCVNLNCNYLQNLNFKENKKLTTVHLEYNDIISYTHNFNIKLLIYLKGNKRFKN